MTFNPSLTMSVNALNPRAFPEQITSPANPQPGCAPTKHIGLLALIFANRDTGPSMVGKACRDQQVALDTHSGRHDAALHHGGRPAVTSCQFMNDVTAVRP